MIPKNIMNAVELMFGFGLRDGSDSLAKAVLKQQRVSKLKRTARPLRFRLAILIGGLIHCQPNLTAFGLEKGARPTYRGLAFPFLVHI